MAVSMPAMLACYCGMLLVWLVRTKLFSLPPITTATAVSMPAMPAHCCGTPPDWTKSIENAAGYPAAFSKNYVFLKSNLVLMDIIGEKLFRGKPV
jgi:hypothetical protein